MLAALMAVIPAGATATPLCVQVEKNGVLWHSIPARPGSEARLSFQHSIYGSRVEEVFRLAADGFYLTEIRYAERRLLEFYGHEAAESESGAWVVRPRAAAISSLALRTSFAARMSVVLEQEQQSIRFWMPADGVLHMTIASCKAAPNG
jgi:hypothetical protein